MNKKFFLLLLILGFYSQFSFALLYNPSRLLLHPSKLKHLLKFGIPEPLIILSFRNNPKDGDNFLKLISSNLDFKVLKLDSKKTNNWPTIISLMPKYDGLDLSKIKLQPSSIHNLYHLDKLNELIYLNLSENPGIAGHISSFNFSKSTCKKLKFLNLSYINIQLEDLAGLSQLKKLTHLDLSNCELKNDFLKELSQHENIVRTLQELNISNNPEIKFDTDLILNLLKFKKLKKLFLINADQQLSIIYSNLH